LKAWATGGGVIPMLDGCSPLSISLSLSLIFLPLLQVVVAARVRPDPPRAGWHRRLLTPAPHLLVHGVRRPDLGRRTASTTTSSPSNGR
jgi:hypothetical protein